MNKATTCTFIFLTTLLGSCQVYVGGNGNKHWQMFPARDKTVAAALDTERYAIKAFSISDFMEKKARSNGKRIIEQINGADIIAITNCNNRYYLYFWNPTCAGTHSDIHKLDSMSGKGENVMIISLRNTYDVINRQLTKTSFSQFPIYTIDNYRSKKLLIRKIRLMKDACPTCYEKDKDDLAVADYLLIDKGTITPVMYNDHNVGNVLSR